MAVNVGTIKSGTFAGPGAGTTVNITNILQDTGSNRYMYLLVQRSSANSPDVTYNGTSMTRIVNYSGQSIYFDIYELANPDEGYHTLTLTYNPYTEYTSDIGYMVISCTGAAGYGNYQTGSGAASSPGLDINISSVSSGSAVLLFATLPHPTNYAQTMTIDGSSTSSPTYNSTMCGASRGTGWFKENVSTGNCNLVSTYGYNMAGVALEVTASASASLPSVTIQTTTNVGETSATGNGTVVSDGGATVTARGFVWNTTGTPTMSDNAVVDEATGTGVYDTLISPLISGQTYYIRAYAINSVGTAYSPTEETINTLSTRRVIIVT